MMTKNWYCIVWVNDKPIRAFDRIDQAYRWAQENYELKDCKFTWQLIDDAHVDKSARRETNMNICKDRENFLKNKLGTLATKPIEDLNEYEFEEIVVLMGIHRESCKNCQEEFLQDMIGNSFMLERSLKHCNEDELARLQDLAEKALALIHLELMKRR